MRLLLLYYELLCLPYYFECEFTVPGINISTKTVFIIVNLIPLFWLLQNCASSDVV